MKNILIQNGLLNEIDIEFADYLCGIQKCDDPQLWLLTAMLSFFSQNGDSAFDPRMIAGKPLSEIFSVSDINRYESDGITDMANRLSSLVFPDFNIPDLLNYSKVIGAPGEMKYIIFDSQFFYLNKFFNY